jgi:signal transduction histidine kinase
VTGHTLATSFADALVAARAVVPNLKRIALVGDPLERQPFRFQYLKEIETVRSQVDIIDLSGLPVRVVKERVSNLPPDAAILYTTINVDGDGKAFLPSDALEEIATVANRPIVIDIEERLTRGGIGGFIVKTSIIGTQAGHVTARLLNGEPISNIPVTLANAVKPIFNWHQLQRWNVDEARLPPGSEVRFRKLPIWREYPVQSAAVAFALLLQAGLITGLILQARRRRAVEAEKQLLLSEVMHLSRFTTAGELTASIAHEVRQPLAAVAATAGAGLNWLKAAAPNVEELRSALQEIVKQSHRANGVIDSVLALFRKNSPPHSLLDLTKVVDRVLALCAQKIDSENIVVEKRLSDGLTVKGDPVQLEQLFLNLIMNAIEAMSQTNHARVLSVTSRYDGAKCAVEVQDTGPGLDPGLGDQIFQPFITNKASGIGLGLAICKSIVDAHGGRITASRNEGRGMTFSVTLPQA